MKTVTIPTCANPFIVMVNGVKYCFPAGVEMEVPDEVAEVIEAHHARENAEPTPTVQPPFGFDSNGKLKTSAMPDGYPYVKNGGSVEIVPMQRIRVDSSGGMIPVLVEFVVDQTYTVVFDDTEYTCTAWECAGGNVIGRGSLVGWEGMGDDVPFFIGQAPECILVMAAEGTHTLSVSVELIEIVKIDSKFLPTSNLNVYTCYSDMADDGKAARSCSLDKSVIENYGLGEYARMKDLLSAHTITMYEGQTEVGVPAHLTYHEPTEADSYGYVTLIFWSEHDGGSRIVYNSEYNG
jgi:hypothetical protein